MKTDRIEDTPAPVASWHWTFVKDDKDSESKTDPIRAAGGRRAGADGSAEANATVPW